MTTASLSVTIACYNHDAFVGDALEAIMSQSRAADQIVLVDDGSTDNSYDVMRSFADREPRIQLVRFDENRGARAARQHAIELCTGTYLYNAAADDRISAGFIEKSMNILEKYPQAGMSTTLSLQIDSEGNDLGVFPTPVVSYNPTYIAPDVAANKLRHFGAWFMGNTAIYKRAAIPEAGGHRPDLGAFTDGFLMHVIALRFGACYIPEPLACWRKMPESLSSKQAKDVSRMREVIERASWLMESPESPYAGLFPKQYPPHWRRRNKYWMGEANLNAGTPPHSDQFRKRFCKLLLLFQSATWPASLLMLRWWCYNFRYRMRRRATGK
jgi:glycosyltransferase involved in cell wall biosynthesis